MNNAKIENKERQKRVGNKAQLQHNVDYF